MTTPRTPSDPLPREVVTFVQHHLPGLDDGEYRLTVSQRVDDSAGNPISGDALSQTYTFAVVGDRFALARPTEVVLCAFPDDNQTGEFDTVLPHVVFTKKTFPWARYPTTAVPYRPPPPGQDTDADVPTWLAVLVLDEDDAAAFPGLVLAGATATVGDLFPPAVHAASSLGANYSYFRQATDTRGLDPGQTVNDPIRILDVPLGLFWQVAPALDDLPLLAHARRVSLLNKPTRAGVSDKGEPVGDFSIVFGNRLPQAGKKSYAYLVSLEELQDFLPPPSGGPPAGTTLDGTRSLRLAVLKSWAFFSTGEPAAFRDRLLGLNGGSRSGGPAAVTNLRLGYTGTNATVAAALDMGYVPLNHRLRTGERTASWYRGPLAPYDTGPATLPLPVSSPDQVTAFDPTTGMFDVSYAAAWTVGRLIALQDTAFATALYKWKKELGRAAVAQMEQRLIQELLAPRSGPAPPAATAGRHRMLLHEIMNVLKRT